MSRVCVALMALIWAAAAPAVALELGGSMAQGGMLTGRVPPGSEVSLDGEALRVSADGVFAAGFDRDADPEATLAVVFPDGSVAHRKVAIAQRDYDIQRIDGRRDRRRGRNRPGHRPAPALGHELVRQAPRSTVAAGLRFQGRGLSPST